ncbi:MAG: hypothetical protein A2133_07520 [Actinobacteria bacterium RBG_16_64_13]|nr:MAG: hypothetical protein A2133_07520 [Actinobacteria bacterium RBG_16_64_13]
MSSPANTALVDRRTIRQYLPKPVPDNVVRDLLTEARWAPSATNTQSTYVYVVTGEPLKQLKAENLNNSKACISAEPDIEMNRDWPPLLQSRMSSAIQARETFIKAEETKKGAKAAAVHPTVAVANLFGAPVLLILAFDKTIVPAYGGFDAGVLAQSIALAAHARGLGTSITGSAIRYAYLLRRVIPETEDKNFVIAIALGYPDWEAASNRFPRQRAPLDEWVSFVG